MMYQAYQTHSDVLAPLRFFARHAATFLGPFRHGATRNFAAACEILARAALTHDRPDFNLPGVAEEVVTATPFGSLLHFRKIDAPPVPQPKVLLVAPMSGHFATLLAGTARTMLADHDVYITDWHNARDIPLAAGSFDFDDFIAHLIAFLEAIGPGGHMMAVCQPAVPALAATALMAEEDNPAAPRSLILMAGPIDTRVNPTQVNDLATQHPIEWFEHGMISRVPWRYPGALRRVYPGFVQIGAFMAMNLDRHLKSFSDLYGKLVENDEAEATIIRAFYEEYFAVMDLPAEFYLQTVRRVFQDYELARGVMTFRNRRIVPAAIRNVSLMTVEGEKDDICAVGQTLAAQDLCTGIRPYRKVHYVQPGAGHYGVFNGKRWIREIYPLVRDVIYAAE